MDRIQYYIHLSIHSRYRLIIHLFIFGMIYLSFYSPKAALCMMNDSYLPEIAENKTLESRVLVSEDKEIASDIKIREIINSYIEPAREIEQLRNALEIQESKARNAYDAAGRFQEDYWFEKAKTQKLTLQHEDLIQANIKERQEFSENMRILKKEVEVSKTDYENQIRKLTNKINRQKVEIRDLRTENSRWYQVDPGKY